MRGKVDEHIGGHDREPPRRGRPTRKLLPDGDELRVERRRIALGALATNGDLKEVETVRNV